MADEGRFFKYLGSAKVKASDGSTTAAGYWKDGACGAVTYNGAGSYSMALAGVPLTGRVILVSVTGSTGDEIFRNQTTVDNLDVLTFDGGAATDKDWEVAIFQTVAIAPA
jgi:hypothetical protein